MNHSELVLNTIIDDFREENEIKNKDEIFDYFVTSLILKEKEIDYDDISTCIVDGGNDGGIDSFAVYIDEKLIHSIEEINDLKKDFRKNTQLDIYIIQNKNNNKFSERVFEKLIPTFKDLLNHDNEDKYLEKYYNPSIIDKTYIMRKALISVMTVSNNVNMKIIYACKGDTNDISQGVYHKKDILKTEVENVLRSVSIEINILGSEELRNICMKRVEDELIVKCHEYMNFSNSDQDKSHNGKGIISVINLKDYFNFITEEGKIRETMMESNIRHYQGKVKVNKGINETLINDKSNEFWWLNNGITILCTEIIELSDKMLRLKDPQIVNGLQTTFCIINYLKDNPVDDKRKILVKIIEISDESSIDKIIASTNSQTEVRSADLRATHELQRDIEKYFLSKGFYYERRKHYYSNLKKDKSKIFTIAKTAQYIETLLFANPHKARSNPTTLTRSDETYNKIFNKEINLEAYLSSCKIFKVVDRYIKNIDVDHINSTFSVSIKNFTFHLMLLSTFLVLDKTDITDIDLVNIDTDLYKNTVFGEALLILFDSLSNLTEISYENSNVLNLAKSKKLTQEMIRIYIEKNNKSVEENCQ